MRCNHQLAFSGRDTAANPLITAVNDMVQGPGMFASTNCLKTRSAWSGLFICEKAEIKVL